MTPTAVRMGKVQVWEYGRRKLGYGDYNADRDGPYPKWSGMEAHKLYLSMRKRRVSNAEFVLAVDFCHAVRMRIENAVWVLKHIPEAKEWQARNAPTSDLAAEIDQAIGHERSLADGHSQEWITRLTRAQGEYRKEVLDAWSRFRNLTKAPL